MSIRVRAKLKQWDYLIVTASNESQARAYESQLKVRKDLGLLSSVREIMVVPDPAVRKMTPNPDFLPTVEANIPKDATIIIGCMAGGRSQYAAEVLQEAGYQRIANMRGGFGGVC